LNDEKFFEQAILELVRDTNPDLVRRRKEIRIVIEIKSESVASALCSFAFLSLSDELDLILFTQENLLSYF
jgi:hypothetical protein